MSGFKKSFKACARATLSLLLRALSAFLCCLMRQHINHLMSMWIRERCRAGDQGTAEADIARWHIQTLLTTLCVYKVDVGGRGVHVIELFGFVNESLFSRSAPTFLWNKAALFWVSGFEGPGVECRSLRWGYPLSEWYQSQCPATGSSISRTFPKILMSTQLFRNSTSFCVHQQIH